MSLTVLDPGLYTLPADGGRPRTRHLGVPVGGAADRAALALGNALVGNPPDAVALELTMSGPTLAADRPATLVLFGAPFLLAVGNKARVPAGQTFTLDAGDTLKISGTPTGVRGYLCAAGGFDVPESLGSRSAHEPLKAGDIIACGGTTTAGRSLPFVALPDESPELRVLPGPQFDRFLSPDQLTAEPYAVAPASNRMGVRLAGVPLERRPGEIASEPVAPGAVQVTNDGLPVVLGIDGQTIGGYPKVAHVIRADLDRLAQLRPGSAVRFRFVTPAEAAAAWAARSAALNEWLLRLAVTGGRL